MSSHEHLRPLIKRMNSMNVDDTVSPWTRRSTFAVGGLTMLGFDRNSDMLLVVSGQGRGVFDCASGTKLDRDPEPYLEDSSNLEAEGIGCLNGRLIRLAGLMGGGLPLTTHDGWAIESVTLNWPITSILLIEPMSDLYASEPENSKFHKIFEWDTVLACGFSPTGRSLIIATSSDLTILGRES